MSEIGFNANPVSKSGIPLPERIKTFLSVGATAIELSPREPEALLDFNLTREMYDDIRKFRWISIHAPYVPTFVYDSGKETREVLDKLSLLCKSLPVMAVVVHPYQVNDFSPLEDSGLPFMLENMDRRRNFGILPEHFEELKRKYRFGFVFDVQHAWEQDPTMETGKQILSVMGDRLSHMHVSGRTESEMHCPLNSAENRDAIIRILEMGIKTPKIMEGCQMIAGNMAVLKEELELLRGFEKQGP